MPLSTTDRVITPTAALSSDSTQYVSTSTDIRASKPLRNYTDLISTPAIITLSPIGTVYSPYLERFGCPRQPMAPASNKQTSSSSSSSLESRIELIYMDSNARLLSLRGLDGFDYVHVIYLCHLNTGWSPLIQPPRGPKKKQGVFATRSPHRPNSIGLSLLKIKNIDIDSGIIYFESGCDILNGTPVIDIKPYIPQYDTPNDKNIRIGWLTGLDVVNEPDHLRYSIPRPLPSPPSLASESGAREKGIVRNTETQGRRRAGTL
jgi:tRNA-Thr(GGU) m(6)t(6)A37 methyltransferase TsaA